MWDSWPEPWNGTYLCRFCQEHQGLFVCRVLKPAGFTLICERCTQKAFPKQRTGHFSVPAAPRGEP